MPTSVVPSTAPPKQAVDEPALEALLNFYDTNNDDIFHRTEVRQIVADLTASRTLTRSLQSMLALAMVVLVIMAVSIFGLARSAAEAAKESHVKHTFMKDLDGANVRTQNSDQMVHVAIDADAIIAARARKAQARCAGKESCPALLVTVGKVKRSSFLDNVNNVKRASRKGLATVTRCHKLQV